MFRLDVFVSTLTIILFTLLFLSSIFFARYLSGSSDIFPEPASSQTGVLSFDLTDSNKDEKNNGDIVARDTTIGIDYVFNRVLENHNKNIAQLKSNVKFHGILIIVSLLLILRQSDVISIFGSQIPLKWLHLIIPIVFLYIWLEFGYLFNSLIESRIQLVDMLRVMIPEEGRELLAAGTILQDSHFIDGWMMAFVDTPGNYIEIHNEGKAINYGGYSFIRRDINTPLSVFFLALTLGTLMTVAHACTLAITATGVRRYVKGTVYQRSILYYATPLLPLSIIVLSHYQFAYGGQNKNWLQLYAIFLTPVVFTLLTGLSSWVDRRMSS